jgi:hypothetical protein
MKHGEAFDGTLTNAGELNASCAGALTFDATRYYKYVEDFDLTEEQKVELLKTLFSIMSAFVEIGFGVDSVQRLFPALGASAAGDQGGEIEELNGAARDWAQGHVE